MWLFTRYGFFSIVCGDTKDEIVVRARHGAHLENLQERFPTLRGLKIFKNAGTDYQYRIIVNKRAWKFAAEKMVDEMTWHNFKDEARRYEDAEVRRQGTGYVRLLHAIWQLAAAAQSRGGR